MERRTLGKTGLSVSVLGFGGAPLGDEYGGADEAEATRALHAAIDGGIDLVDVAPYYGRTLAEERLGRALGRRRSEVVLATKCCRFDRRGFDFSAERVRADIEASLTRLRTDYVDLYQIHDVEFGSREVLLEETLPALDEVKRSGKARFVGITGLPVGMLRFLAEAHPVDTVLSYCHHNLLVRDLDPVLGPLAQERGVGILNASPLHMGILKGSEAPPWHPAPAEVKALAPTLEALCQEAGTTLSAFALRFALDLPSVSSTLVGMQTTGEVEENLRASTAPLDRELLARIDARIGELANRTWHEGLPENAPGAWTWTAGAEGKA